MTSPLDRLMADLGLRPTLSTKQGDWQGTPRNWPADAEVLADRHSAIPMADVPPKVRARLERKRTHEADPIMGLRLAKVDVFRRLYRANMDPAELTSLHDGYAAGYACPRVARFVGTGFEVWVDARKVALLTGVIEASHAGEVPVVRWFGNRNTRRIEARVGRRWAGTIMALNQRGHTLEPPQVLDDRLPDYGAAR